MRRFLLLQAVFFFLCFWSAAEEAPMYGEAYLVPQTIFVGDRGRFVTPLGKDFNNAAPFVSSNPETLIEEERPNLVITRIELENKSGTPRLLVDFVPYAPGRISFPPVLIPSGSGPLAVKGIAVNVASILRPGEASLSAPASPLASPGTGLMIYSTAAVILVFLLAGMGGAVWGSRNLAFLTRRFQRKRLIRVMRRLLKRLRADCTCGKNSGGAELFSLLSAEFRDFLSFFTGVDCRAFTPGEFISSGFSAGEDINLEYLSGLFRRWEIIRFGGSEISRKDFLLTLDEVRDFIISIENSEKARKNHAAGKKDALNSTGGETAEAVL